MELDETILKYYDRGEEAARLDQGYGPLERLRTQILLDRYLPAPPAVVLDVGGAAGVHGLTLAARGYSVHLIDPVPLHVEQARAASSAATAPLASVEQGDARDLAVEGASADAVLLLGPLYHLTEAGDRLRALAEALRALRPGGVVVAAGISRFAPLLDNLRMRRLADPGVAERVLATTRDGGWRDGGTMRLFTTAYFHHPAELLEEVTAAGFVGVEVLGVEGPVWLLGDVEERLTDATERDQLLRTAQALETEASLLGASPHLLAIGRRDGGMVSAQAQTTADA